MTLQPLIPWSSRALQGRARTADKATHYFIAFESDGAGSTSTIRTCGRVSESRTR